MRYPEPSGWITLLTDFGLRDHYVGVMKGVIARIHPEARVVDISHGVEPYSIWQGAFLLEQSYRYFPEGTVHVTVVDPGVGSSRKPLVAVADGHYFVGPDNGVFSQVFERSEPSVRKIDVERYGLEPRSRTFDGRDVFSPAAAWLSRRTSFEEIGPKLTEWITLDPSEPQPRDDGFAGRVLNLDRFGNIVTSFRPEHWSEGAELVAGSITTRQMRSSYADANDGEPFAIIGSAGLLEISIRQGSAAQLAELRIGAQVFLRRRNA